MTRRRIRTAQRVRKADIDSIRNDVAEQLLKFGPACRAIDEAGWALVETFVAISLRVMANTNPSKLIDAARTEEIKARIHNREVIEDDEDPAEPV